MLDSLAILKEARDLGSIKTLSEIDTILNTYDYVSLREVEKVNYRIEIWDKVSSINGIEASVILADMKCESEVYLIYVNGKLTYLQTHSPSQMGWCGMDVITAMSEAQKIVDGLIETIVDKKVKTEILKQLLQ